MRQQFTGRHMAAILVGGFGIVMAVNFYMASLATQGFGGVVVENSYVASQKFNGWLEEARAQDELGWSADVSRDAEGRLRAIVAGVPVGAEIAARLRRPLGQPETREVVLLGEGGGAYGSAEAIPAGRWIVRVTISSGADRWTRELRLE